MAIIPKAIYGFNEISIQIVTIFFPEIEELEEEGKMADC
jgi:hypothetical protein